MKLAATLLGMLACEGTNAFSSPKPAFSRSMTQCSAIMDGRKIEGDFTPLNNLVLVKVTEPPEETEGGIVLTGQAKAEKPEGTVVSVGPGKLHQESGVLIEMPVEPGDSVVYTVYGQFAGTETNIDGKKHRVITDNDILVKFKGDLTLENADVTRDSVLVKVEKKTEEETTGGILLAKSSTKGSKSSVGEVVKVGPGRRAFNGKLMEMDVAVGDMVKFRDFAGEELQIGGEDYSVVRMNSIILKY